MRELRIEREIFEVFPQLRLHVFEIQGIDNHSHGKAVAQALKDSQDNVRRGMDKERLLENPVIDGWRKAYKAMKVPKGNRCSVENLVRRVLNGNDVPSITLLVDVFNIISLDYLVPCGGSDLSRVSGDITLKAAVGDEPFVPLGSAENSAPLPGEIIYADSAGALCRCLNWREGDRACLREDTKDAFLIMETLDLQAAETLEQSMDAIQALLETTTLGKVTRCTLSLEQPACTLV